MEKAKKERYLLNISYYNQYINMYLNQNEIDYYYENVNDNSIDATYGVITLLTDSTSIQLNHDNQMLKYTITDLKHDEEIIDFKYGILKVNGKILE